MNVKGKYLKDETGNIISPIVNLKTIYNNSGINLLDLFYPVGSYYETSNSDFNPNINWRTVNGIRSGWNSFSTGAYGTGIVSRSKTTGSIAYATEQKNGNNNDYTDIVNIDATHNHTVSGTTGSSGSGNTGSTGNANPFSIIQPSKVVYRWHRVV